MNFTPLRPGSHVAVVSPSGPVLPENIEQGLQTLRDWDLIPHLLAPFERHSGYLAGSDTHRLQQLNQAFSGEFEAVFCTRGGYGATRIVEHLTPRSTPILIGFSDVSALHLRLFRELPCVHGPVLKSMPSQPEATQSLRQMLFEGPQPRRFDLTPVTNGQTHGPIVASNLSVLVACLDAPWFPDLDGHILVLEDVGEVDYRLDRLLTTLRTSRRARGLAGLVLGDFNNCAGVYVDEPSMPRFLAEHAAEFDVPAALGFPTGHLNRNEPVLLGTQATLNGTTGELTFV